MKNLTARLSPIILTLFAFSCDNNENLNNENCAQAKLIQQWCPDSSNVAVITIASKTNLGEDWTNRAGRTFQNVLLAQLDSTLLNGKNWSELIMPADSTFYFTYSTKTQGPLFICYICCPPSQTILITAIASSPCAITTDE